MTTQTLTLADFLLARIAEDEATDTECGFLLNIAHHEKECSLLTVLSDYGPDCDCSGLKRWLAECGAKRRIVESLLWHEESAGRGSVSMDAYLSVEQYAKYLAAIYADHPDYREEWRA